MHINLSSFYSTQRSTIDHWQSNKKYLKEPRQTTWNYSFDTCHEFRLYNRGELCKEIIIRFKIEYARAGSCRRHGRENWSECNGQETKCKRYSIRNRQGVQARRSQVREITIIPSLLYTSLLRGQNTLNTEMYSAATYHCKWEKTLDRETKPSAVRAVTDTTYHSNTVHQAATVIGLALSSCFFPLQVPRIKGRQETLKRYLTAPDFTNLKSPRRRGELLGGEDTYSTCCTSLSHRYRAAS